MKKILFLTLLAAGITATAQVKVGTNPTNLATNVNLQVEGTTTTNQFVVLKNGNVGIGTTAPAESLQVLGNISFSGALMPAGVGGAIGSVLTSTGPSSAPSWAPAATVNTIYNANGTIGTGRTVGITDTVSFDANTFVIDGTNNRVGINISPTSITTGTRLQVDGGDIRVGVSDKFVITGSGALQSSPANGLEMNSSQNLTFSAGGSERMRIIGGNGNVGIGTTAPTNRLTVSESGAKTVANIATLINNTATSSTASVNKTGLEINSTGAWNGATAVNTGLGVTVSGGTTNYAALFNGGNVGIGTTTPAEELDVVGDIRFSRELKPNGIGGLAGQLLISRGVNLAPEWVTVNAASTPVSGVLGTGYSGSALTTAQATGTQIILPPGKWLVSTTILLRANTVLTSTQALWFRFYYSDSLNGIISPDSISGDNTSGALQGPSEFGIAQGSTVINNTSASPKIYSLVKDIIDISGAPAFTPVFSGLGGSVAGENNIIAIPMN